MSTLPPSLQPGTFLPKTDPASPPPALATSEPLHLLLPYQARALKTIAANSFTVIEKSRRIGLTWAVAAYAALEAAKAKSAGGQNVLYMGYDLEMTREFVEIVGMWASAFHSAAGEVEETVLEDGASSIKIFRITFASGHSVTALPAVPRALRGKQGIVIFDEAAFHDNLQKSLKAAMALLIWGGRVVVLSTHLGQDNAFNQIIDDVVAGHRKGASLKVTFNDALEDGLYQRIKSISPEPEAMPSQKNWVEEVRGFYGEDAAEELDCIPATGSGAWLDPADITACEHPDAGKPEFYAGGPCYVGWDVARRNDLSVRWVFEEVGGVLWLRERQEKKGQRFSEQYAALAGIIKKYRVIFCNIDQTGMGEAVVEAVAEKHGSPPVAGILMTGPNRIDMASVLKKRFEDGLIRIPPDPAIRADLRAIKKKGGTGLAPPRLVEEGSVHPDMFWAAALACKGASSGAAPIAYKAAGNVRPGLMGFDERGAPEFSGKGWGSAGIDSGITGF